jgi:hypothetical protein
MLAVHGFDKPVLSLSTESTLRLVEGLTTGRYRKGSSHPPQSPLSFVPSPDDGGEGRVRGETGGWLAE